MNVKNDSCWTSTNEFISLNTLGLIGCSVWSSSPTCGVALEHWKRISEVIHAASCTQHAYYFGEVGWMHHWWSEQAQAQVDKLHRKHGGCFLLCNWNVSLHYSFQISPASCAPLWYPGTLSFYVVDCGSSWVPYWFSFNRLVPDFDTITQ